MTDDPLSELREDIDATDVQIITLLNERARLAVAIGKIKSDQDKQAYDPSRERSVIEKVDSLNKGPLPKGSVEDIYAAIITACRELQMR